MHRTNNSDGNGGGVDGYSHTAPLLAHVVLELVYTTHKIIKLKLHATEQVRRNYNAFVSEGQMNSDEPGGSQNG